MMMPTSLQLKHGEVDVFVTLTKKIIGKEQERVYLDIYHRTNAQTKQNKTNRKQRVQDNGLIQEHFIFAQEFE